MISGLSKQKTGKSRYPIRKSSLCLSLLGLSVLLLSLMFIHAYVQRQADGPAIDSLAVTVRNLELTDLALWTEARYTRHLSQADLHAAFQDHPSALEHFPTGSVAGPPERLRRSSGKLD